MAISLDTINLDHTLKFENKIYIEYFHVMRSSIPFPPRGQNNGFTLAYMSLTHNKFSTQSGPKGQNINRNVVVYNAHIQLVCGCTPHRMPSVLLLWQTNLFSLTKCLFMFNIRYFWYFRYF
jgi:hypothetical protein